jgi:hypothetical protein
MKREDVIRMAQEAGMSGLEQGGILENFERFAALVAEKEREECAKVCDETTASWTQHTYNSACNDCAAAIRAKKE